MDTRTDMEEAARNLVAECGRLRAERDALQIRVDNLNLDIECGHRPSLAQANDIIAKVRAERDGLFAAIGSYLGGGWSRGNLQAEYDRRLAACAPKVKVTQADRTQAFYRAQEAVHEAEGAALGYEACYEHDGCEPDERTLAALKADATTKRAALNRDYPEFACAPEVKE